MAADFYVLECEVKGCDAELWLNDIPVIRRGPKHGLYAGVPVNQFVCDGPNVLTAIIRPGSKPSGAATGGDDGKSWHTPEDEKVWAKLSAYEHGAVVGGPGAQHLIEIAWPPEPKAPAEHPLLVSGSADLGEVRGKWAFEDAPVLVLDDATKKEVAAYLMEIQKLLDEGDCEAFLKKQRIRLDEGARAYDARPAKKKNEIRRLMADEFGQDGYGFLPIDEGIFDLRLVAGGRMIECVGSDWEPLVRQKPDAEGNLGFWDMMLAKIDGEWQIVR